MSQEISLKAAMERIERLEGALMGFDCFAQAILKALPPETAGKIEKWAEVELAETKTLMNASPDHSDAQIAGLDEFAHTFGRVRRNR
jgi:hypothetical protein